MRVVKKITWVLFASLISVMSAQTVHAEEAWPERPIHLVVPFTPGGSTDIVARKLASGLQAALGTPVVVENRPGAGGTVGSGYVSKKEADGYTLLLSTVSTHAVAPSVYASLPYDPIADFTPISLVATFPQLIAVHSSVPADSLTEFVDLARKSPLDYAYASNGNGTTNHLAVELIKHAAGVDIMNVPYKGSGPALIALLGGEVSMMMDVFMTSYPHAKSGKLKALAVTSLDRSILLPEVPTVAESGFPGYEANIWFGLFGPAGMPERIQQRLADKVRTFMESEEMKSYLLEQGGWYSDIAPTQFSALLKNDIEKWKHAALAAGVKPQ